MMIANEVSEGMMVSSAHILLKTATKEHLRVQGDRRREGSTRCCQSTRRRDRLSLGPNSTGNLCPERHPAAHQPTTSSGGALTSQRMRGRTEGRGGGGGRLQRARRALRSLSASNSTTTLRCCKTDRVVNGKKGISTIDKRTIGGGG